jgi:hypothetical protein
MEKIQLYTLYRSFTSDEIFKLFSDTDLSVMLFNRALNCSDLTGRVYVKLFNTDPDTFNFIIQQQPKDIDRNCILYQYKKNIDNNFTRQVDENFSIYQHLVLYTYNDILNMLYQQNDITILSNHWTNKIIL